MRGKLEIHAQNMREKNRVWRTSLKFIALSDLIRLKISIYISLDQQEQEIEINHPQNSGQYTCFWEIGRTMKD